MLETPTSDTPSHRSNQFHRSNMDMDWSVSELTGAVWEKKWLIVGCIACSVLLGMLYLQFGEPIYAVRARVLVQHQGSPLDDGTKANRDKEFLATQAEIISSPAVIERVLPVVTQSSTSDQELDPMLAILSSLEVDPVSGTNVLSVSYRCQNPEEGIKMVDGILHSYQQFLQKMNDGSRSESLRLLTRSEEKLRADLEDREEAYLQLREQSPLLGQQSDVTAYQSNLLENLAKKLVEAREHRINLGIRQELLAKSSSSSLAVSTRHALKPVAVAADCDLVDTDLVDTDLVDTDLVDTDHDTDLVDTEQTASERRTSLFPLIRQVEFRSAFFPSANSAALDAELVADVEPSAMPEFTLISRELLTAEMREKELAQHGGAKHPGLCAAREQVVALRERLDALRELAPFALQRELTAAQTRESELFELYQQELEKAKANDRFLVKESLELDGIERLKTIHNSMVAQLNDWHLVEPGEDGGMGVSVVVLESPTIGIGPVWPKKSLLLSLCVATGLLGGIGIVVLTKV